jgi:hypothetical protein
MTPKNSRKRKRARATPARNAFAYTLPDAQAMGAPGKTTIYQLAKAGILEFVEKKPGCPVMITGDSLRALLGVKLDEAAPLTMTYEP